MIPKRTNRVMFTPEGNVAYNLYHELFADEIFIDEIKNPVSTAEEKWNKLAEGVNEARSREDADEALHYRDTLLKVSYLNGQLKLQRAEILQDLKGIFDEHFVLSDVEIKDMLKKVIAKLEGNST